MFTYAYLGILVYYSITKNLGAFEKIDFRRRSQMWRIFPMFDKIT